VELSRREFLDRQTFFLTLTGSFSLLAISVVPEVMRSLSAMLGLEYSFVLVFTLGILGLTFLNIYTLSKISRVRMELKELSQEVALED
jgi:hypothetical protein